MQLLILGNGFDLQCNLPSSFGKYMSNSLKSIIIEESFHPFYSRTNLLHSFLIKNRSILKSLTFIELLIIIKFWKKEVLWSDFEKLLYELLYQEKSTNIGYRPSLWIKSFDYLNENQQQIFNSRLENSDINNDFQLIAFLYFYWCNFGENIPSKITQTKDEWHDFLKKDLSKFESRFTDYLKLNHKDNVEYQNSSSTLLSKLTNSYGQMGIYKIMNFNYTMLPEPYQGNTENVHGLYSNKDSIIGIDGSSIPHQLVGYKFTKTFRRVDLLTRYNRIQKSDLLNYDYSEIAFYGHSLNEQDYSYFQSLFDGLNIYDKKVKLKFYYSFYEGKTNEEIYNDQIQSIIKLLETYGNTFDNKYKGKNLLNKIIIEQRLHIINI